MSFNTFVKTLDSLRREAPRSFKGYHPRYDDVDKVNQARAKAFIHLFLKVRFGLADFRLRHEHICDGIQDGGVDAYYIDQEARCIAFLQAKCRTSEKNFEEKTIDIRDLLKMEVGRISRGDKLNHSTVVIC